ncbi:MAG TPA: GNAT family N-acetyltransferase [Patescibacteria group bacterium]|nr:GNAT family N-acetyltransferase [Patescibacteria group bacterium]
MIEIKIYKKNQIAKQIDKFVLEYNSIGYKDRIFVRKMLLSSLFLGIAYLNNKAVGLGRIIGDGVRYSFIVDVMVNDDYRGKGVGKKLVQKLARTNNTTFIQLNNDPKDPGLKEFYQKVGFKMSKDIHVFEWPNNKKV